MTSLSEIGDIRRFESPRKLVGYAGLGAGVHDGGQKHHEKGITKFGRQELAIVAIVRKLLVTLWYLLNGQETYNRSTDRELV